MSVVVIYVFLFKVLIHEHLKGTTLWSSLRAADSDGKGIRYVLATFPFMAKENVKEKNIKSAHI